MRYQANHIPDVVVQVERVWDMINKTAKEAEEAMMDKVHSLNSKSVKRRLKKQDLKMSILLQFISKGRELKRLQKIGKEFEDFVLHSHKKRCVQCEGRGWCQFGRKKL